MDGRVHKKVPTSMDVFVRVVSDASLRLGRSRVASSSAVTDKSRTRSSIPRRDQRPWTTKHQATDGLAAGMLQAWTTPQIRGRNEGAAGEKFFLLRSGKRSHSRSNASSSHVHFVKGAGLHRRGASVQQSLCSPIADTPSPPTAGEPFTTTDDDDEEEEESWMEYAGIGPTVCWPYAGLAWAYTTCDDGLHVRPIAR
ncbi:hypothetical protein BKA81DRAFT_380413 [Phyllosticta paracitricarpa]